MDTTLLCIQNIHNMRKYAFVSTKQHARIKVTKGNVH